MLNSSKSVYTSATILLTIFLLVPALSISKGLTEPESGIELVEIPAGCYEMGDKFNLTREDARPVHEVCLDSFYLGKFEITQEQWRGIMGYGISTNPKGKNYPVNKVSWEEAMKFIDKLNTISGKKFRLPTEAEWEYAARSGGKDERYSGDDKWQTVACVETNSSFQACEVGRFNPNGLGLHDMSGNVWEWCSDWYDETYYMKSPKRNPAGPKKGMGKVIRGGSWTNGKKYSLTVKRYGGMPDWDVHHAALKSGVIGLRIALDK